MIPLAYYLLKVAIGSGLLYGYYLLALRNRRFHQWNRFYLLAAVALSLLLPLLAFTLQRPADQNAAVAIIDGLQKADAFVLAYSAENRWHLSTEQMAGLAYLAVSLAMLVLMVTALWRIRRLVRSHTPLQLEGVQLLNTTAPDTPFSFWRYIFWNERISLQTETGRQIFNHELVHVRERHTLDKLFLQAVLILFWCNPFFWLIRRELAHIHEFIADRKAVGEHGTAALAAMLLQSRFPQQYTSLINPFFQTSIKRRLAMLTQNPNPRLAYAGRVIALPVLAFVALAFTMRTTEPPKTPLNGEPTVVAAIDTVPKSKTIESVNVRTRATEIEVRYTDGTTERLTEAEAKKRKIVVGESYDNSVTVRGYRKPKTAIGFRSNDSSAKPLFVVDGKEITQEEMETIEPETIAAIDVLKGASATALYGEKGKNGVVVITLKKPGDEQRLNGKIKDTITWKKGFEGPPTERASSGDSGVIVVTGRPIHGGGKPSTGSVKEVTVVGKPIPWKDRIFLKAEQAPSVDMAEWRRFLEKHALPVVVKSAGAGAKPGAYVVNLRFVVNTDGSLTNFETLNDPGYGLAKGLLQVMKTAPVPKWKPAIQNGIKVRSFHTQPVTLMIQES